MCKKGPKVSIPTLPDRAALPGPNTAPGRSVTNEIHGRCSTAYQLFLFQFAVAVGSARWLGSVSTGALSSSSAPRAIDRLE